MLFVRLVKVFYKQNSTMPGIGLKGYKANYHKLGNKSTDLLETKNKNERAESTLVILLIKVECTLGIITADSLDNC